MKKSKIRPGMNVLNRISGNTGIVCADREGNLTGGAGFVGVTTRVTTGRRAGQNRTAFWLAAHLELVP